MRFSIKNILTATICLLLLGCVNNEPSNDKKIPQESNPCKYGTPTAIFSKELQKVKDHSFSAEGQKGIEKVNFENGMDLELLQSGCNELLQSYRFGLSGDLEGNDQFWIEQAVEQFKYLSTLSDNHVSFGLWSGAIQNSSEMISIGESFEPEPNTFIKIDKIPTGEKIILVVTFEAKD